MFAEREADEPEPRFRVEELSIRTGAPVRTIREYQTWQILHPPARVGRVGLYDESHVRRLEGIARLQTRGYSIAAIRDLFEAWEQGVGLHDVLGLDETIGLEGDEAPLALTSEQLDKLIPSISTSKGLLSRACSIGLLYEDGNGYIARSPALLQVVADAMEAGLSPTGALDLAAAVVTGAQKAAEAAAAAVVVGSEAGIDHVESLVRRGRVLLARAIATHTIDQVGRQLAVQASSIPELGDLLAEIRIGTLVTPPTGTDRGSRPPGHT